MNNQHVLEIAQWTPATLNQLLGVHWAVAARRKKVDRRTIVLFAHQHAIPHATGKRKVSLIVEGWPRGRLPDPDAFWKSTLDALVHAHMLIDDSSRWCELGSVDVRRSAKKKTKILLENIAE